MKLKPLILLPLLAKLAFSPLTKAQEPKIEKPEPTVKVTARNDFMSKYIFRGLQYSKGPVASQYLTLTPKIPASLGSLAITGFGNFDFKTEEYNEADIFVDWSKPVSDKLTLLAGWGRYTSPTQAFNDTQEAYAGLTSPILLNPTILGVRDFQDANGNYFEASASQPLGLLSLGAKIGYNDRYFRRRSGLSHLETSLSTKLSPTQSISLEPFISHSHALDKKDFQHETFGGLKVNYSF